MGGALAFGQTITVLLGIDAAGKHMGERAQEFTAKTGIKVNLVEVEWDAMVNKQAVALKAKEPTYDIVDCGSFMLPEYVPGGLYADISDMYTPAERARFMDGMLDGVTIGGKLYAAPLMASWTIMFYNSEMFLKAGLDPNKPPKTWDELVAYGQKLQSPPSTPSPIRWGPASTLPSPSSAGPSPPAPRSASSAATRSTGWWTARNA